MEKSAISVGQHVHYAPSHGPKENGIVKSITEHGVFVVYNCGGNWDRYTDYTAANTNPRDLEPEWASDARNA
jgi:hypothetical protein